MIRVLRILSVPRTGMIAICMTIMLSGCSEKGDTGPIGPDRKETVAMVLIPAGSFLMGNITNPDWSETGYEVPVHRVTLTRPFLMSRTEVTQKQYEAVMGINPSHIKGLDLPVASVSWIAGVEFCNELSRRESLNPCYTGSGVNIGCDFDANGYRLPTEAEWEYACRAGTETDFYTGNMTRSGYIPDSALERAGWYICNSGANQEPSA